MKIAMLGTRGVPAHYGGFETAVEEVGQGLVAAGHEVTVYCRNPGQTIREHLGMRLVNLPAVRLSFLETLSHTALSVVHALVILRPDVVIMFNAANAPLVPLMGITGTPVAVHIDGLEWQRAKWTGLGKRYYRWAERLSVHLADDIIADAQGIQDYVWETYRSPSVLIAYGAPIIDPGSDRLAAIDLQPRSYHLVVARWEPENHVDLIIDGYRRSAAKAPLIVVGSAPYSESYGKALQSLAAADSRVRLLGPVWDQELLDQLYANALSYLHGHSVGGTNPSLLRALGAGAPVTAYDVVFNREVTGGHSRFFSTRDEIASSVEADEQNPDDAIERGALGATRVAEIYRWQDVIRSYDRLCKHLVHRGRRRLWNRSAKRLAPKSPENSA